MLNQKSDRAGCEHRLPGTSGKCGSASESFVEKGPLVLEKLIPILLLVVGSVVGVAVHRLTDSSDPVPRSRPLADVHAEVESDPTPLPAARERDPDAYRSLEGLLTSVDWATTLGDLDQEIVGELSDPEGNPLSGVRIVASAYDLPNSLKRLDPTEVALDSYLEREAMRFEARQRLEREAVTDEAGNFTFSQLFEGRYLIQSQTDQLYIKPSYARAGATLKLIAVPGAAIEIELTERGARFQEPVTVILSVFQPEESVASSPKSRRVLIKSNFRESKMRSDQIRIGWDSTKRRHIVPLDRNRLSVTGDFEAGPIEIELNPTGVTRVEAEIMRATKLTGRVLYADRTPLRRGWVWLLPASGDIPTPEKLVDHPEVKRESANRGRTFEFRALKPGKYWIGFGSDHQKPDRVEPIELVGLLHRDFFLEREVRDPTLVIEVSSPEQKRLELQFVNLQLLTTPPQWESPEIEFGADRQNLIFVSSDFERALSKAGANTDLKLTYGVTGYGNGEWQGAANTRSIEIELEAPGYVDVTIEDSAVAPAARPLLTVNARLANSNFGNTNQFENTDKVRIGPLNPGEYLIELGMKLKAQHYSEIGIVTERFQVVSGDNSVELIAPPIFPVEITFPEKFAGTSFNLKRDEKEASGLHDSIPPEAIVRFPGLPAGRYQLQLMTGMGVELMSFEVIGPTQFEFEAQAVNALEVSIYDDKGTAFQLGFRDGDLVVAIDGVEFENMNELQTQFAMAMSKEEITLGIDRRGRRVSIKIKPKELMGNQGNLGANLEPAQR